MADKYDVVVTNPPYMGGRGQNSKLKNFLKNEYPDTKSDTFSAFIEQCGRMSKRTGYLGMFTPYVWMFIQSYENMRNMIYNTKNILTLIQFEYSAFEEATVPVCTFVIRNMNTGSKCEYIRLVDYRGGMEVQRIKTLEAIKNPQCGYRYSTRTEKFREIPGSPVAYWVSDAIRGTFNRGQLLRQIAEPRQGLATGENNQFVRFWFEASKRKIGFDFSSIVNAKNSMFKWFPYNKGGEYRKWYGNNDFIVNWENDGFEIRNNFDDK
jgi:hypothetical protein